jgi:hypothetical protein
MPKGMQFGSEQQVATSARLLVIQIDPALFAPKKLSLFFPERYGAMSLTYSEARTILRHPMNILPVDRARWSYMALLQTVRRPRGARERLSEHLMKMYIEGEKDEHRLTVEG